jgi:transposase-like protein
MQEKHNSTAARLHEERCYAALRRVRWPLGVMCPLCQSRRVTTHTKFRTTPRRRYLCLSCRKTFTDLTGTPFMRTNLPLSSWLAYLRFSAQGQSTTELAEQLGVKWDTVTRMRERLGSPAMWPTLARQLHDTASGEVS